jgi:hypothetical protein
MASATKTTNQQTSRRNETPAVAAAAAARDDCGDRGAGGGWEAAKSTAAAAADLTKQQDWDQAGKENILHFLNTFVRQNKIAFACQEIRNQGQGCSSISK